MSTLVQTSTLLSSRRSKALMTLIALLLGAMYYVSLHGSVTVQTRRNPVAFADTSHYVELLSGRHYVECLGPEIPHNIEHRRKTIHHFGYLLFGDAVISIARLFGSDASDMDLIWLLSPLLAALNFALAFLWFSRHVRPALVWPGALIVGLAPATWIYASIPETWMLTGTAVLIALHLRDSTLPRWISALVIGALALNNFLILLLVVLLPNEEQSLWARIFESVRLGVLAGVTWIALLIVFGLTLSADFLPLHFFDQTVRFKQRMAENLSIFNPARWAYNGVNGWLAPFVLNQSHLNFGRTAVLDSARTFPLGTAAVAGLVIMLISIGRHQIGRFRDGVRASGSWLEPISNTGIYLALVFIATGLALYYESFLYSPLILPILVMLGMRSLPETRAATVMLWAIAIVWAANAAQQMAHYRHLLVT